MSDTIKIRVYVGTKFVGSEDEQIVEVDREEWEDMSDSQQEKYMREIMFEMISWGYDPVED